jgi:RNAse (barnase) inhibitor barstar
MENVTYIEGSLCSDKQEMFSTFSEVLGFPQYFSNNWDSFEEIINDLELNDDYKIIIIDWKKVLSNDKHSKSILRNILKLSNKRNGYRFLKVQKIG